MKIEYSLSQLLAENIAVSIDGDTLTFETYDTERTVRIDFGILPEQLEHCFRLEGRTVESIMEDTVERIESEILAQRLKDCRLSDGRDAQ